MFFSNECFVCRARVTLKPCSRCNMVSYCGSDHQKIDWPKHKDFCQAISSLMKENGVSHIYEKLRSTDLDNWSKERDRMCSTIKSKLGRPLHLYEEQMLLLPKSCFVCYETRQELLTTCAVCLCANFCKEHPSSSQHDKDCLSLKLFRELDGKIQDPTKLKIVLALIGGIVEGTKFRNSSDIPVSMEEYLDEKITSGDYIFEQASASNILTMPLTLFNAAKKLNLFLSKSRMLFHIRCDLSSSAVWELLLHFLPTLNSLKIVFFEQNESQKLKIKLCNDCSKKKLILETKNLSYKDYVKDSSYQKPDIFGCLNIAISEDDLETLSRIGSPLLLTSATEKKGKIVAESLKSTFWPSLIFEGFNEFAALDPLREWTDGSVSRINQFMIITKSRVIRCQAGILSNVSLLLSKAKDFKDSQNFYSNLCHLCRSRKTSSVCPYCKMIFYCSQQHVKQHWPKHKDICGVIQRLHSSSKFNNVFDQEMKLIRSQKTDPEAWFKVKLNLISKVESKLDRKLLTFEKQMFFFPATCFACHETNLNKLETCDCGISLCLSHINFPEHKTLCNEFYLNLQLNENRHPPNQLPKSNYVSEKEKPNSLKDFINTHLILKNEVNPEKKVSKLQKIIIGELLTKPLTLHYALKKMDLVLDSNSEILVHVIGSRNAEIATEEFWDIFFHLENLKKLSIIFLGQETKDIALDLNYPLQSKWRGRNLSIKSYSLEYAQFVRSRFFVKPDIIVGYNLDIHECDFETLNCSCKENILTIREMNFPFVITSGSKERALKDHKTLSAILETSICPDLFYLNPFASLEPERDFETERLRYSNKCVLIYSKWTETSTDNEIFFDPEPLRDSPEKESAPGVEQKIEKWKMRNGKSGSVDGSENLNDEKVVEVEETIPPEESTKSESENLGQESKSEFKSCESEAENMSTKSSITEICDKSEFGSAIDEILRENLILKEEIRCLKENLQLRKEYEELIKNENQHLKEKVNRIRNEFDSI